MREGHRPLIEVVDAIGPAAHARLLSVLADQLIDIAQQVCPAALLEPGVVVIGGVKSLTSHFYLAVLVARLVGMHTADTRRPR